VAENRIINPRHEVLKLEVSRLVNKLIGTDEIDFAIDRLQDERQKAKKRGKVITETRSREFLNQRWTTFGTQFEGPWPIAFDRPLVVTFQRAGIDLTTSKPYTDRYATEITEAKYIRLGREGRARYVELELPAEKIVPEHSRQNYGMKADDLLTVYCTIAALHHAQPKWVLDGPMKARLTRLRMIAAEAAAKVQS
jgi:hypothetical protein